MRIEMTDRRERLYRYIREATGKGHKSQALDAAAVYYCRMAGGNEGFPTGKLEELLARADEQGSVTPQEIVEILDCPELALEYHSEFSVGAED